MEGLVFNIQRFSVHDGPGIRTNVFLSGCPLRCLWCHNPEGQKCAPALAFLPEKCVGCGACAAVCPQNAHVFAEGEHRIDRSRCLACGKCAAACLYGALEQFGRRMDADEVVRQVERDAPFFADGGGVTLTGGEPMAQFDFALSLAKAFCENGIDVCMETSGYAPWEHFAAIAPYISRFLFDVKLTDDTLHKTYTGVPFSPIWENLKRLDALGAKIVLRCPIIPGVNDNTDHLSAVAALAGTLRHLTEIDLEPYHPLGIGKCHRLGIESPFPQESFLEREKLVSLLAYLSARVSVPVREA